MFRLFCPGLDKQFRYILVTIHFGKTQGRSCVTMNNDAPWEAGSYLRCCCSDTGVSFGSVWHLDIVVGVGVYCIDISTLGEQRLHHIEVAIRRGLHQRGITLVNLGINVGSLGKQHLHHIEMAIL